MGVTGTVETKTLFHSYKCGIYLAVEEIGDFTLIGLSGYALDVLWTR